MAKENDIRTIPFSPPDITELEVQYVTDALRSGWITTGPRTKKLEKLISQWIHGTGSDDVQRCVCLSSATAALELSLRLLGIGPFDGGSADDEVITCAYTYTASASTTLHVGAKIVLVDCASGGGTLEMDYDRLEAAITEHTKAIVPVDLGGIPCDYDRIFDIVERKKHLFKPSSELQRALGRIAVVADSAHAFGAKYKGRMIGDVADFADISFHAVKNFTVAEGGTLAWRSIPGISDEDIHKKLQLYSLHGQSRDAYSKTETGSWEYDIVGPWYNCGMTDISAAIGLAQFERYPGLLARRREIIRRYDAAFKPLGIETLEHYTDEYASSGHLYITRIPGIDRKRANAVMKEMDQRGISTNVHYKPLPMHTAYRNIGFDIKDYPNAYARFENEITLPLYTRLSDEDVDWVIDNYCDIVRNIKC